MIRPVERSEGNGSIKAPQGAIKGHKAEVLRGETAPVGVPKNSLLSTKREIHGDTKIPQPKEAKMTSKIYRQTERW